MVGGTALGYMPSFDSNSVASFIDVDTMTVNVPDHIYVMEITPPEVGTVTTNIYPNPGSGFVNIATPYKISGIEIINDIGQTILAMCTTHQRCRLIYRQCQPASTS